jgi:hypothetical protein
MKFRPRLNPCKPQNLADEYVIFVDKFLNTNFFSTFAKN